MSILARCCGSSCRRSRKQAAGAEHQTSSLHKLGTIQAKAAAARVAEARDEATEAGSTSEGFVLRANKGSKSFFRPLSRSPLAAPSARRRGMLWVPGASKVDIMTWESF